MVKCIQKDFIAAVKKMRNKIMDKVRRIQELRRSNAATPVKSKKEYTRKIKHKNKFAN
jgi:hypothetical protein